MRTTLPSPRGDFSRALFADLRSGLDLAPATVAAGERLARRVGTPLDDDDLQIALHVCYELHYRGYAEVDDHWEWEPSLLRLRGLLEARFEEALHAAVDHVSESEQDIGRALAALIAADGAPSMSRFMLRSATEEQWREFLLLRSVYHLKEADPHTWVIPRLGGRTKAAVVEIQADEYGGGDPRRMHAALFARVMRGFGLDDTYGAHVDAAPAEQLATVNAMSMLGLQRRLRGAVLGHLAAIEMTSTEPNRRYGAGARRLGRGPEVTLFFDEHVEADAVHEQIASVDMCGSFVASEPELYDDVLFGAAVALVLEGRAAAVTLGAWAEGRSALRTAPAVDSIAA